jgi:hypothetical protein
MHAAAPVEDFHRTYNPSRSSRLPYELPGCESINRNISVTNAWRSAVTVFAKQLTD